MKVCLASLSESLGSNTIIHRLLGRAAPSWIALGLSLKEEFLEITSREVFHNALCIESCSSFLDLTAEMTP